MFGWNDVQQAAWDVALLPVLKATVESGWPPAAKFLYELQLIAHDLGQEIFAVDPPACLLSFGKRPMLRKLTPATSDDLAFTPPESREAPRSRRVAGG